MDKICRFFPGDKVAFNKYFYNPVKKRIQDCKLIKDFKATGVLSQETKIRF